MMNEVDAAAGRTANGEALASDPTAFEKREWCAEHADGFTASEISRRFGRRMYMVRAHLRGPDAARARLRFIENRPKVLKCYRLTGKIHRLARELRAAGFSEAALTPIDRVADLCARGQSRSPLPSLILMRFDCAPTHEHD